jgi:hypothetical protein
MEIVLIIIVGLALYFLPAIIGWKKKNSQGILLLNLFLGWTLLGWIGALMWAVSSDIEQRRWVYTCSKCGFKNELNQKSEYMSACNAKRRRSINFDSRPC